MTDAAEVPRLTEDVTVCDETIKQVWMCDVPAEGVSYLVVRDHYEDDYTVRVIDEIRLV